MGYMDSLTFGAGAPASTLATGFNPAAAIGGLALEAGSAWYGNRQAEKRQHEAFDQQKWMMQNRYQMQTKDLMAAGLNPMLAVNQGAPMPNAPGPAPVKNFDPMTAVTTMATAAQAQKTQEEAKGIHFDTLFKYETMDNNLKIIEQNLNQIRQNIKTGESTEALNKAEKALTDVKAKLGSQEWDIRRPEQLASAGAAAEGSAKVSRVMKPLIDILGGLGGAYRNFNSIPYLSK